MARGRQFSGGRRRPVTWAIGPSSSQQLVSATGKILWTTSIVGAGEALERTIMRIRGGGLFSVHAATAAQDGYEVGLGIGLVSEQAFTAGAASIPGPLTDRDWDGWIWHSMTTCRASTATIADGVNSSPAAWRFEIDSKAMRKWDSGADALVGMLEVTELGSATAELQANTRLLLKQ